MRNIYKYIGISLLIILGLSSCLHADTQNQESMPNQNHREIQKNFAKYTNKKNITINGIDYLQSQMPIGKFGGTLFTSTLGDGPQTFNPFNSKDALSSEIAGLLYDGLTMTDANTGEVIPKLAKSFEVTDNGKKYIIHLRRGIKWSDGKPLTADDVFYTWNTIIFGGFIIFF